MCSFVHDVKWSCLTNSAVCRPESDSSATACENAYWVDQSGHGGRGSAGYQRCHVDRRVVIGRGLVDLYHVFSLTNHGAERALRTYSAVGLVPSLATKFTSTSVAQDLRTLSRANEYRIDFIGR